MSEDETQKVTDAYYSESKKSELFKTLESFITVDEYVQTYTVTDLYISSPDRKGFCSVVGRCDADAIGGTGIYDVFYGHLDFTKLPNDIKSLILSGGNKGVMLYYTWDDVEPLD